MEISEMQSSFDKFCKERRWDRFRASVVFIHMMEEAGEIGRYILFEEGYKKEGLGHEARSKEELAREFAHVLNLFVQLANHFGIDLESAWKSEIKNMEERFVEQERWKEHVRALKGQEPDF